MGEPFDRAAFRLVPSEEVLWHGRPERAAPADRRFTLLSLALVVLATVSALFSLLLAREQLVGASQTALVSVYLVTLASLAWFAPRYWLSSVEYVITDTRVLARRGRIVRSMERHAVTFGRIRWHANVTTIGHLELHRATPFGPLSRKQRLVLSNLRAPDVVFAMVRSGRAGPLAGAADVPLIERLDEGETVRWGSHPEGGFMGWREVATAVLGAVVLVLSVVYLHRGGVILFGLEQIGLAVRSWEWVLLFSAVMLAGTLIAAVGIGLVWYGVFRSRALTQDTEYLVTDRRLLIRRGRTELSVDVDRIVDIAQTPSRGGLTHVFLVLDSPEARALADSGALAPLLPSRDPVPPVLYDLRDPDSLRDRLLPPKT